MPTFRSAWVVCALLAAAAPAHAGELAIDWKIDGAIILGGALTYVLSASLLEFAGSETCRWCDVHLNGLDAGVRDALRLGTTDITNFTSHITAYIIVPGATLGLLALAEDTAEPTKRTWVLDATIVVESVVIAANLKEIGKALAARRRPFVRFRDPAGETSLEDDDSFFSGHTTIAFAFATASGTVAALRGYRSAPALWVSGLTLAAATGYLRIAADRHYFTDVLAGAVVGSAVGILVPYLHRRGGPRLEVGPRTVGLAVTW